MEQQAPVVTGKDVAPQAIDLVGKVLVGVDKGRFLNNPRDISSWPTAQGKPGACRTENLQDLTAVESRQLMGLGKSMQAHYFEL